MSGTLRIAASISLALAYAACDPVCGNTVLADVPSPDERRHAVVFERDCGAATDFSTQVSVLTRGREARGAGNVFVADGDHGAAPPGPGGGPAVRVRWLDRRTLEVRYHPGARVFRREARHDDTDVRFVPDSAVDSAT